MNLLRQRRFQRLKSPLTSHVCCFAPSAWTRCTDAVRWQLSARKPFYAVFFLILAVILWESQTYYWADGWSLQSVADSGETSSQRLMALDRVSAGAYLLQQFVSATDERVRFMGRHTRLPVYGSVQFDNTGAVFGLKFRRSMLLGVSYHEVCSRSRSRFSFPSRLHVLRVPELKGCQLHYSGGSESQRWGEALSKGAVNGLINLYEPVLPRVYL